MKFLVNVKIFLSKSIFGKKIIKIYHYTIGIPIFWVYKMKYKIIKKNIKNPNFYTDNYTFEQLIFQKKSISRFGDGEISWIYGNSKGSFNQENSKKLGERLKEVLQSEEENLLIAIPNFFNDDMKHYSKKRVQSRNSHLAKEYKKWMELINFNKKYSDALITRVYLGLEGIDSEKMFSNWKKVWDGKKIIIIEGNQTRFGVGNDLIDNSLSRSRIIAPSENAFGVYDEILKAAIEYKKDDCIFLISLGPTASILSYDLNKLGYQAIDIGHLDIEYEWFIRKTKSKIPIPGKYVNEAGGASSEKLNTDVYERYESEIKKVIKK